MYLTPIVKTRGGKRLDENRQRTVLTKFGFTPERVVAAADAYMRGIARRIAAGLNPTVCLVASVFISRWDKAVLDKTPHELRDQLGIAVAKRTYHAYRGLLDSNRFQRLAKAGARAQRLLWASTGTKDPETSDILYVT